MPACFRTKLFPPLEQIARAFVRLTVSGILPHHAFETLLRLLAGFAPRGHCRRRASAC